MLRLLVFGGVALGLSACATTDKGQRTVGQKTTDLSTTEAMLDEESEKAEEYIKRSAARIKDTPLESYVQGVANKSAGEFSDEVTVYLLKSPAFNAFMMPNGTMGVNSGLMLRVETEDELALILGHEFGHFYENHSLERHAAVRNANYALTALTFASAGTYAATGTYVNSSIASTAVIAGYFSFNRNQESEADRIGLEKVENTGYDSATAIRLWENLDKEKKASSLRAIRKRHSTLYDTHPTNIKRLGALKASAGLAEEDEIARGSIENRRNYRARIRPHLLEWLNNEIDRRDAGATLNLLDRLDDIEQDKGVLLYTRARVMDRALSNKRLKKDKVTRALMADKSFDDVIDLLTESSKHADAPAVVYRELGNSLYKKEDFPAAITAFERYLSLAPNAEDKLLVNSLLDEMKGRT